MKGVCMYMIYKKSETVDQRTNKNSCIVGKFFKTCKSEISRGVEISYIFNAGKFNAALKHNFLRNCVSTK